MPAINITELFICPLISFSKNKQKDIIEVSIFL